MEYKYSATLDAFYPANMLDAYADLPTDLIDVSEDTYDAILHARAEGLAYKIADDGAAVSIAPSSIHGWDAKTGQWVLNKDKQTELVAQEKAIADAQLLEQKRAEKRAALDSIIVVTKSGKSFDGNETARVNMLSAITASEIIGQTKAGWKLADNTLAMVNVSEIKEALALSIIRVGQIVSEG